jgi:hypothetical protein
MRAYEKLHFARSCPDRPGWLRVRAGAGARLDADTESDLRDGRDGNRRQPSGRRRLEACRRSVADEILVGKTELSYTYTQPVREGVRYNMYHGTLEARPVTATTSKIVYTLFFDNSNLPDQAAKDADLARRKTQFMRGMNNMKTLAEGGTLPPPPARGGR